MSILSPQHCSHPSFPPTRLIIPSHCRRFFKHFHPSCSIFLTPRAPVPTHQTDPLLFWAIIAVASRGPPLSSGMQNILEGVSYVALAEQVKSSVAALGIYPPRTLGVVQALLLLCEWPLPANRTRDDRTWHYSSLVRPLISILFLPPLIFALLLAVLHRRFKRPSKSACTGHNSRTSSAREYNSRWLRRVHRGRRGR